MSGLNLISPLLDHFMVGEAISDHNGVRCYPAMREDSDDKYILKIISIPASQVQMEALLLTGAYPNRGAALKYYKELADNISNEATVLQKLSKLEGFLSYEDWQIVPKSDDSGWDVYLLGSYKRSLTKQMRRTPMTHLGAVNLGLDLCSALAVCRRAGCLYVDLKPENIFIAPDQSFRIGDLGFIPLDSLKYASLPEKYRSSYTAPEIQDAFSTLNTTIDIFALGLILYQVYNDGQLPVDADSLVDPLPAPVYADYEMAEIILKACAVNPADRWQDPSELGQAIVGYMQRNGVNDTPIIPLPMDEAKESASAEEDCGEENSASAEVPETETDQDISNETQDSPDTAEMAQESDEDAETEQPDDRDSFKEADTEPALEDDIADLTFIQEMASDETAPSDENTLELADSVVSQETSDILAQADELIAHEAPEPVVAPEPVEIIMPEPIVSEPEHDTPEPSESVADRQSEDDSVSGDNTLSSDEDAENQQTADTDVEDPALDHHPAPRRKKGRRLVIALIAVLLAAFLGCGYYFYQNYYLLPVSDMSIQSREDKLTVSLTTEIPDEMLTVVCSDTYGNVKVSKPVKGIAQFDALSPETQYWVTVQVDGFHKLTGKTKTSFVSDQRTDIVNFSAVTGPSDGSVILNFTVDGYKPNEWTIAYSAEGEAEKCVVSKERNVTISNLTVGKEYTFRLIASDTAYMTGTTETKFTARNVVLAQNPRIVSCKDGVLLVNWAVPENETVDEWVVHCYSQTGYDETIRISGNEVAFTNIKSTEAYSIDIQASDMTTGVQVAMTAHAITVTDIVTDFSYAPKLYLQWGFDGNAPSGGWIVTANLNGAVQSEVAKSDDNTASISSVVPGAHYQIVISAADGTTVFNNILEVDVPEAKDFSGYRIDSDSMDFQLCYTPDEENWDRFDLHASDFTNTFKIGEKASILGHIERNYSDSQDQIQTMIVIRNAEGIPVIVDTKTHIWSEMWSGYYCGLDIPDLPSEPGTYTVHIYFNGMFAGSDTFQLR